MTLEAKINAVLEGLCPRTFPDFAPTETELPYVTYQQIGGVAESFLDNTVPSVENGEVQINVWAGTRMQAKGLIKQIEAALIEATDLQARPLSACASDFDVDMRRYCSRQDFSIWANR